ncbi:MAG: hypothetical protein ABI053_08705 [Lacisediminihabitans sp.]
MTSWDKGQEAIDGLQSALLESIRIGAGNWRFHFSHAELTMWGALSVTSDGQTYAPLHPLFYPKLLGLLGCELSSLELRMEGAALDFGNDAVINPVDEDGVLVTLKVDAESTAHIWSRQTGNLVHSTGEREPFDAAY